MSQLVSRLTSRPVMRSLLHLQNILKPTYRTEAAIEKTDGHCVQNAEPLDDEPFNFCKSDGSRLYSQGGCQCMTGCKADRAKKETFLACEAGSYKPYPGEDLSDICPPCSISLFPGSVECFLFSTT